jgi:hypothetical protein
VVIIAPTGRPQIQSDLHFAADTGNSHRWGFCDLIDNVAYAGVEFVALVDQARQFWLGRITLPAMAGARTTINLSPPLNQSGAK